jgi:cation diffusion facilitator family transporter
MAEADHAHPHNDPDRRRHAHAHGVVDPSILSTDRGIWAIKWSFVGLFATAAFQLVIVLLSGSVALLADTVHNIGDAATAIPLWIAFALGRRKPSQKFTYGYGRVEDLAGVVIVAVISLSAVLAGYESVAGLLHPRKVEYLWAVVIASIIGFAGNEAVAVFRIQVGREIGSAALVADGYHARVDGLTSLAVLVGALGVWAGYPMADPLVGIAITIAILKVVWESGASVFGRLLDRTDPETIEDIEHAVKHIPGVKDVGEVRTRWLGHRLHAELNIAVDQSLSVEKGHEIANKVRHELLHHLRYLSSATIHIDPANASGEEHHRIGEHAHDNLPRHSHS